MSNYLSEAFKKLEILDEDVFDLDKDGLTALKDFEDKDEEDDSIAVIDPDAESEEDLEDSYIGKVILDCSVCHTDIYKDKEDITIDEEAGLANIGEECPYCYSSEGFKVIGEVKPFVETTFETDDDVEVEVDDEEVEEDEDMNESMRKSSKTYKKLNEGYSEDIDKIYQKLKIFMDRKGYDVTDHDTLQYLAAAAEYIGMSDEEYPVAEWYRDTKMNYPEELAELKLKESLKESCSINQCQKWVDYDMKKYKKISDDTMEKIKSSGYSVVKDQYGDYEVIADRKDESLKESADIDDIPEIKKLDVDSYANARSIKLALNDTGLDKLKIRKLYVKSGIFDDKDIRKDLKELYGWNIRTARDNSRFKSEFYVFEKIKPTKDESCGNRKSRKMKESILSEARIKKSWKKIDTIDAEVYSDDSVYSPKAEKYGFYGGEIIFNSTRLPKEGTKLKVDIYDISDDPNWEEYGDEPYYAVINKAKPVKESIEDITIDTGDQEITVSAKDKEKIESDGEMIAPLSDEMKADIEMNSDDVDVDVDEFSEEDFDELGESYLKKVYENVDSYRTTSAKTNGNKLFVEGLIKFNSGKEKKTSFVFESRTITKSGKAKLIGENLQISRGHKSFKLTGTINNGKFISESLNYNYRVKNGSESQRVYGTAKKSK